MSARTLIALLAFVASEGVFGAEPASAQLTVEQRQGRELFSASCAFCHDQRGHATRLLGKRLGEQDAMLERRTNLSPELIRHVVRHGINSMPVYRRAELSDDELGLITAYLTRTRAAE